MVSIRPNQKRRPKGSRKMNRAPKPTHIGAVLAKRVGLVAPDMTTPVDQASKSPAKKTPARSAGNRAAQVNRGRWRRRWRNNGQGGHDPDGHPVEHGHDTRRPCQADQDRRRSNRDQSKGQGQRRKPGRLTEQTCGDDNRLMDAGPAPSAPVHPWILFVAHLPQPAPRVIRLEPSSGRTEFQIHPRTTCP